MWTTVIGLDFREAANGLACCWRERPSLRPALVMNFRKILPEPATWQQENGEVAAIRVVLNLARSPDFPKQQALQLLLEVDAVLDPKVTKRINTLPLFELVWNMAALRYERETAQSFTNILPKEQQKMLLAVLADRVRSSGSNEEKLALLALAGLLAYLCPQHKTRLTRLLAPLKGSTRWLFKLAMEQNIIVCLFALLGISMPVAGKNVFTPMVRAGLLLKAQACEDVGPALENLRQCVAQQSLNSGSKRK